MAASERMPMSSRHETDRAAARAPARRLRAVLAVLASAAAACALLGACGSLEKDATAKWDADRLYNEARGELRNGAWSKARELYEKLEARYPFGRYAQQAQIEIAYCYYKEGETADAMSTTDRFLKFYPNSPRADYVYYLRGLINFIDTPKFLGPLVGYRVAERDPKSLQDSFEAFKELVSRYPNSPYYSDALMRISFLRDALADHEISVADYYYRRGAYLAAINRSQAALREYQGAPRLERALGIIMRSYDKLGMTDLRDDARRVLKASFPQSRELGAGS
jgi:outer membrane protein assembly factor BamD